MSLSKQLEVGVCVLIMLFCGAVIYDASKLPPGHFEPLGSAPFPIAIAALVLVLCMIAIVLILRRVDEGTSEGNSSVARALFFVAMLAGYAAVFATRVVDFGVMTTVFLFLTIGGLEGFKRNLLPWIIGVSLIVGFGTSFIFTRFLFVDLPVWY